MFILMRCFLIVSSVKFTALHHLFANHVEFGVFRLSDNGVCFHDITPIACFDECQARPGCTSANVRVSTHQCCLNMDASGVKTQFPGIIYSEKSDQHMVLSPECVAADCNVTQVCVSRDTGVKCEFKECQNPPTVLNGKVLGNQRHVGARISIRCDYNYGLVGPMSLTCRDNGHWAADGSTTPTCIGVCPTPDDVPFASVEVSSILEGSNITYICDENYILSGPANFTCNSNGTWVPAMGGTDGQTYPECELGCSPPPDIDHGMIQEDGRSVGSHIHYNCTNGLHLSGTSDFVCEEVNTTSRHWTPSGLCNGDDIMTTLPKCVNETCVVKSEDAYMMPPGMIVDFSAASAHCEGLGQHLVSFSCEEEYNFVKQLNQLTGISKFYTGLNNFDRPCFWTWRNSTDGFTFPGEKPDAFNKNDKKCLVVEQGQFTGWVTNYTDCVEHLTFVCESELQN